MRFRWALLLFAATSACPAPKIICSASTCLGCCDSTGHCQLGDTPEACGFGGLACFGCATGLICAGGACTTPVHKDAGPDCITYCATGCCDDAGQCHPGSDLTACGTFGVTCVNCPSSVGCVNKQCGCGPATCDGCCLDGGCIPLANETSLVCGTAGTPGGACTVCGGLCDGGSCVSGTCDTFQCPGCCDPNSHNCIDLPFQSQSVCGINGSSCASCAPGSCDAGLCIFPPCGPPDCPGCCDQFGSGQCFLPSQQTALTCGSGGVICQACTGTSQCDAGFCQ